jgi:hypothetical protein
VSAASTPSPETTLAPAVFDDLDALLGAAGLDLGVTDWYPLTAAQLEQFAAATGRPPASALAAAEASPWLVLSLTNLFLPQLLLVPAASTGVNYGTGAVRFPGPARAGDRVRGGARIVEAAEIPGGVQTTIEIRVEVEGGGEPAAVVESLSRWMR